MQMNQFNRRHFLGRSAAGVTTLGLGWQLGRTAQAEDPPQVLAQVAELPDEHVLQPALKAAGDSLKSLQNVTDYVAIFHKRELVGRKMVEARMSLKLREEPFSVYLKFLEPHGGRQVLYVRGRNQDKLLVKDVGFASLAGTLSLDPTGSMAMEENRYPVTSIGLRFLVTSLMQTWIHDAAIDGMAVLLTPNVAVGNLKCHLVEVTHRGGHGKAKFQATRLYIDEANGHPVRVQAYAFSTRNENLGPLVEDYFYSNLRVNAGLSEMDFSTRNREYRL